MNSVCTLVQLLAQILKLLKYKYLVHCLLCDNQFTGLKNTLY